MENYYHGNLFEWTALPCKEQGLIIRHLHVEVDAAEELPTSVATGNGEYLMCLW